MATAGTARSLENHNPSDDCVSVRKVANDYGVSTERVRQLIAEGKLQAVRVGARGWYKIRKSSIKPSKSSDD